MSEIAEALCKISVVASAILVSVSRWRINLIKASGISLQTADSNNAAAIAESLVRRCNKLSHFEPYKVHSHVLLGVVCHSSCQVPREKHLECFTTPSTRKFCRIMAA